MEYYFDELDPVRFQRMINAILVSRFGEDARVTPLRGADGGRDGETAAHNPFFEYVVEEDERKTRSLHSTPRPGRYLFQVKHHKLSEMPQGEARKKAISEFKNDLRDNVLTRKGKQKVNYYFLVTNSSCSRSALESIDVICQELLRGTTNLHADIWWKESITAYLDQCPSIWMAFPEIFAGRKVPQFASISSEESQGASRTLRVALDAQLSRDKNIKFRQIDLTRDLSRLFVDLKINVGDLEDSIYENIYQELDQPICTYGEFFTINERSILQRGSEVEDEGKFLSALHLLLSEAVKCPRKILLQGGPGQGKSTLTQMAAQIYRTNLLGRNGLPTPGKARLPIRIELREFSEYLSKNQGGSIEEFITVQFREDSGGRNLSVENLHSLLSANPVVIFLDGLDEVGFSTARQDVINAVEDFTARCEGELKVDLKIVLTTRPPAILGYQDRLPGFRSFSIAPMDSEIRQRYLERWLSVQILYDEKERQRVRHAFLQRQDDPHVRGLSRNPMQLAVLLHFIRLKGEAFPDKRADLYRAYFDIVIDRDVEKSPELREKRELVETLHQFLAFKIHSLTETQKLDGTISLRHLKVIVSDWLCGEEDNRDSADDLFRLGQERLGLLVALRGEGEDTRYGFEVQPTREYFAAAYINEQGSQDTTEVFAQMIRRPFWFEIGMFLAGLRRPNERADLLVRLKELDDDADQGWRQDGRLAVFELLKEGVLSFPNRVFVDATEYVIGFFDPDSVSPQRLNFQDSELLSSLIGRAKSDRLVNRIRRIMKHEDPDIGLTRLITSVVPKDEAIEFLLESNSSPYACLYSAVTNDLPFNSILKDSRFWNAPNSAIARSLWNYRPWQYDEEIQWHQPKLHDWLIYSAALGVDSFARWGYWYGSRKRPLSKIIPTPGKKWAMIALSDYLIAIQAFGSIELEDLDQKHVNDLAEKSLDLDVSGLSENLARTMTDLCSFAHESLRLVVSGEGSEYDAAEIFADQFLHVLDSDVISSWLALRVLITSLIADPSRGSRSRLHRRLTQQLKTRPKLRQVWDKAQSFFSVDYFGNPVGKSRQMRVFRQRPGQIEVPSILRVADEDELKPLGDIARQSILDGLPLPEPMSDFFDLPPSIIVTMLNEEPEKAEQILKSKFRLSFDAHDFVLPARMRDLCIRVIKNTDDEAVANGALRLLTRSRLEGRTNIKSLMPKLLDLGSGRILLRNAFHLAPRARRVSDKEISELQELAWNLLRQKHPHAATSLVTEAADFLISTIPPELPALAEDV